MHLGYRLWIQFIYCSKLYHIVANMHSLTLPDDMFQAAAYAWGLCVLWISKKADSLLAQFSFFCVLDSGDMVIHVLMFSGFSLPERWKSPYFILWWSLVGYGEKQRIKESRGTPLYMILIRVNIYVVVSFGASFSLEFWSKIDFSLDYIFPKSRLLALKPQHKSCLKKWKFISCHKISHEWRNEYMHD